MPGTKPESKSVDHENSNEVLDDSEILTQLKEQERAESELNRRKEDLKDFQYSFLVTTKRNKPLQIHWVTIQNKKLHANLTTVIADLNRAKIRMAQLSQEINELLKDPEQRKTIVHMLHERKALVQWLKQYPQASNYNNSKQKLVILTKTIADLLKNPEHIKKIHALIFENEAWEIGTKELTLEKERLDWFQVELNKLIHLVSPAMPIANHTLSSQSPLESKQFSSVLRTPLSPITTPLNESQLTQLRETFIKSEEERAELLASLKEDQAFQQEYRIISDWYAKIKKELRPHAFNNQWLQTLKNEYVAITHQLTSIINPNFELKKQRLQELDKQKENFRRYGERVVATHNLPATPLSSQNVTFYKVEGIPKSPLKLREQNANTKNFLLGSSTSAQEYQALCNNLLRLQKLILNAVFQLQQQEQIKNYCSEILQQLPPIPKFLNFSTFISMSESHLKYLVENIPTLITPLKQDWLQTAKQLRALQPALTQKGTLDPLSDLPPLFTELLRENQEVMGEDSVELVKLPETESSASNSYHSHHQSSQAGLAAQFSELYQNNLTPNAIQTQKIELAHPNPL